MEKDSSIPLFVYSNQPISVYIIDNEVLFLEEYLELRNQFQLPLNFLNRLFTNPLTKTSLPPFLKNYLDQKINDEDLCICGLEDPYSYDGRCLRTKMTISADNDSDKVVQLSDFSLYEDKTRTKFHTINYNYKLNLTPYEAFILFSNLIYEARGSILLHNKYLVTMPFDKKQFIEIYKKNGPNLSSELFKIESFCLDYFEHLLEQLQTNSISPETILRLSGPSIVVLLANYNSKTRSLVYQRMTKLIDPTEILSIPEQIISSVMFFFSKYLAYLPKFSNLYTLNLKKVKQNLKLYSKKYPFKDSF